jgi:ATP synthase F0 subunit c
MEIELTTWTRMAAFASAGLCMGMGAIGAAIGEGHAAAGANAAISRNPNVSGDVFKTMLVGQALAESAAIFALVVAMLLLFSDLAKGPMTPWVMLSAGFCMGMGAVGAGIGSGFPAAAACEGTARQPAISGRLNTNMLIGSAVCQTPAIFSLVVAFILLFSDFSAQPSNPMWGAILGAGLASGLGAVGSGLGSGLVAESGCEGLARHPGAAMPVTNAMLLGQAVTQTKAVYGLLISFILMFKKVEPADTIAPAAAFLAAGLCMGIGAIGPGIGEGLVARSAVKWIARNQDNVTNIIRLMLMGMAVTESTGIYSLVISLVLIFVM